MYEGSGFTIDSILHFQHVISEITCCEGSFCFHLPKKLKNTMKGLINIQNEDNEHFRWCLMIPDNSDDSCKQKSSKN